MMLRHILKASGRLFASAVLSMMFSGSAFAALAAGCNQNVWNALAAKADAQVAYDIAVTRAMINKPDSVLTLTCFDKAAGVSAKKGGAIFSGDFSTQLGDVLKPMTVGDGTYNCTAIQDLWNTIASQGVKTGIPFATFDDLVTGNRPGPNNGNNNNSDFNAGWDAAAAAHVFSNLQSAKTTLDNARPPVPDFSQTKSTCEVLVAAKVLSCDCSKGC